MTTTQTSNTHQQAWRAIRRRRDLTLREVARRSGIEPSHLSRVERGDRSLSLEATLRLARVLGLRGLVRQLEQVGVRDHRDDDDQTIG